MMCRVETVLARLARYDAEGETALHVLTEFRELPADSTILDIAKLMARHSKSPARVVDFVTGARARSHVGTSSNPSSAPVDPSWLSVSVIAGEPSSLWLERSGDLGVLDAAIMQAASEAALRLRASTGTATNLERALTLALTASDPDTQTHVLAQLGLMPASLCRVVARPGNVAQVLIAVPGGPIDGGWDSPPANGQQDRTGVSSLVPAGELPRAWEQARTALAFSAAGGERDPGPSLVRFEELGVLADLIHSYDGDSQPPSDVAAIDALQVEFPWAVSTLHSLATSTSVREAASRLFTHHSTAQSRISVIESRLGWYSPTPACHQRVALALNLRRYRMHPPSADEPRPAEAPILYIRTPVHA